LYSPEPIIRAGKITETKVIKTTERVKSKTIHDVRFLYLLYNYETGAHSIDKSID
jgi:hypothetical protein